MGTVSGELTRIARLAAWRLVGHGDRSLSIVELIIAVCRRDIGWPSRARRL